MSASAYKTVRRQADDEYIINKSRFIGYASPCASEDDALAFIKSIREKHRDATHNCYAYVIGENAGIMRYSDDGEPSGTAGMPIMEVLRNKGLVNVCVVVTRYFGGILLGAGGLVRAYSHSAVIAVRAAGEVVMKPTVSITADIPYPLWDKVSYRLSSLPVLRGEVSYTASVEAELLCETVKADEVILELTKMTDGKAETITGDEFFYPWDDTAPDAGQ